MWSASHSHVFVLLNILADFLRADPDVVQGRILNRNSHRLSPTLMAQTTTLQSMPCSQPACPVDDTYPTEFVDAYVASHLTALEQLYSQLYRHTADQLILVENITDSYRVKGNFACESDVGWLKIGWAQDVTGRYLLVINTTRFPQIHRLEACRYAEKRCEYLPPCYKSTCKQRYANTHLIAIDPTKPSSGPTIQLFPLPSSCCCFVENFIYF